MTRRPIVGIHDFLNSRPIIDPIRYGWVDAPFDLVTDTPSQLAQRFHAGELDIALIPSVEYARDPDAVIIPAFCIASLGRVDTVLLFSRKPVDQIKSVCVDPKSRTSVTLMRILLKKLYSKNIEIIVADNADPESMLKRACAGLLIGDSAFLVDHDYFNIFAHKTVQQKY